MLIFTHIFAGAVIGLVLARVIGDIRIIPICIAGALLPDLIDKPLGYLLLPQTLDSGRTFCHTLLIVGIITVVALITWRSRHKFLILGLAGTVLLHQILDEMWYDPVTWFYPLLGPFQPFHFMNFFEDFFWREITSLPEWIFLFSTLVLLWLVYRDNLPRFLSVSIQGLRTSLFYMVLLLCTLGVYSLVCAGTGMGNLVAPYWNSKSNLILGLVALVGCCILIKIPEMEQSITLKK